MGIGKTKCLWFDEIPPQPWEAGWCFPFGELLSDKYKDEYILARPPITVILPSRDPDTPVWHFCLDSFPAHDPDGHWDVDVEGELIPGLQPNITVSPSINCADTYHGFLKHGVLSSDIGV